jgi:hypothetical protein
MRYEIIRLDGRYTYRDLFEYCIKFSNRMAVDQGPLQFNDALKWFFDTYGWSAEIRDYSKMSKWAGTSRSISGQPWSNRLAQGIITETPIHCNPHWSWTNGYDDLRLYVKSTAELGFFQLKFPVDQK